MDLYMTIILINHLQIQTLIVCDHQIDYNGVDYNDSLMQTIPESNRELTSKAQNHILYEVGCNIIIYV